MDYGRRARNTVGMFGIDESQLSAPRRRRWPTVVVVAMELLLGLIAGAVLFTAWLVGTPDGLRRLVERLVGDAPLVVSFDDVAISPGSTWYRPWEWRVVVHELLVHSEAADVRITWLNLGVPDLMRAWATREVRFDHLEASGLDIRTQVRPPIPWQPKRTALALLSSDKVTIRGGRIRVDREEGLDAVVGHEIEGDLEKVRYSPGSREIWAEGSLRSAWFDYGLARLGRVEVPNVSASGGRVDFSGATFRFGGGGGRIGGQITSLQREPDVRFTVHLDARAEALFEAATGKASPFQGQLVTDLVVTASGKRKGDAQMGGTANLLGAKLALGQDINGLLLTLLRQAPWFQIDTEKRILFGDMEGRINVRPGSVAIERLLYHSFDEEKPSQIEVGGRLDEGEFNFVIRLVPRKHPDKAGLGAVVWGRPKDVHFRLAHRAELLALVPDAPSRPQTDLFGETVAPKRNLLQSIGGLFKPKSADVAAPTAPMSEPSGDAVERDLDAPAPKKFRLFGNKKKEP